jgi:hypothetical protein
MIDDQVMCDPHYPGEELSLLAIISFLQGFDHLNKGVLENILGDIPVKNLGIDKTGNPLVVTVDQDFKGFFIPADVFFYKD